MFFLLLHIYKSNIFSLLTQKDERVVAPASLLKLRQMVTQRVQMKGALPWLVRCSCRACTRDFCSALAALVGSVQNIFLLYVHYFNSFVPIDPHHF
jgi:hypothetical protein